VIIHETEHLQVDSLDQVWLKRHETEICPLCLGWLADDLSWIPELGAEPNWWITELAELYDLWHDGGRYARDCRLTADEAYRRAKE
jgi:hypothetical protein